jgi:VanZ family protein
LQTWPQRQSGWQGPVDALDENSLLSRMAPQLLWQHMPVHPLVKYWAPVIGWMLLIFVASGDLMSSEHTSRFLTPFLLWLKPDISPQALAQIHLLVRKLGHIIEYAILAMLSWRALRRGTNRQMKMSPDPAQPDDFVNDGRPSLVESTSYPWARRRAIFFFGVWILCAVFAATDEFHQSFVVSRTAAYSDVLIDAAGALVGLLICWRRFRRTGMDNAAK